jgi:hypothetical protein
MKLQLLTESNSQGLRSLPEETQRWVLMEDPWGFLSDSTRSELIFVGGYIADLCFENLGLSNPERVMLAGAVRSAGLTIPGTANRLRMTASNHIFIEPTDPKVMSLPSYWRQAVYVADRDNQYTWIGKRVRADQLGQDLYGALRLDNAGGSYLATKDGWYRGPG